MEIWSSIEKLWTGLIQRAKEVKKKQFGDTADRIWRYYGDGDHKFLFLDLAERSSSAMPLPAPTWTVTCNLSAEYVRLMLPFVHNNAPHRRVAPERLAFPPDIQAMMQAATGMMPGVIGPDGSVSLPDRDRIGAWLLQWCLGYTANIFDLCSEGRRSVIESLVKGRGVGWIEAIPDQGNPAAAVPGSFFDSVDNLLIDPDSESLRDANFIVRIRRRPAWVIAEMYQQPVDKIRSHGRATSSQFGETVNDVNTEDRDARDGISTDGTPGDIVTYGEIYSRMGTGWKHVSARGGLDKIGPALDEVGQHVFLAILPGFGSPLNVPLDRMASLTPEEFRRRLEWPIKTYGCASDPWPSTALDYYPHPRRAWPTPPLESSLSLQGELDYLYSWLMGRTRTTCRDLILVSKALNATVRDEIVNGKDQTVIPVDDVTEAAQGIHVVQFPMVNRDLYQVLSLIENAFRQSTGLMELMYGGSNKQMRSSAEAQIRQQNMSIRPDDMANIVEDWHKRMAAKEAAALRMHLHPTTVSRWAGEQSQLNAPGVLAQTWSKYVHVEDPYEAAAQFVYSIEAGSGRKKNLQKQLADIQEAMQFMLGPAMQHYQMSGDPRLVNGLIRRWGESHQMDVAEMMLPAQTPPQPQPTAGAEGPQQQQQAV